MKTILLTLLFSLAVAVNTYGAKAYGKPKAHIQPDGTTLMVKLIGSEKGHWFQTIDGVLLVKSNDAFFIAEIDADGLLTNSGLLAHNIDSRSEAEMMTAKRQKSAESMARLSKSLRSASSYPLNGYCPHSGKVRVPIIMMQFPDMEFTFPKDVLTERYNGTKVLPFSTADNRFLSGYGSVRQYFLDASNGNLDFQFDFYGPYTTKYKHDQYPDPNGLSTKMINEALTAANADIDFSQYDSNNDGNIDMVYILYAGHGQNLSFETNDIWPYCTNSSFGSFDGKRATVVGLSNELVYNPYDKTASILAGIGVTCHEMSHGLGLPDLYWTLSSTPKDNRGLEDWNNCGPEEWDLMDGGENICMSIWPVQYAAWEKETMGWLQFEELTTAADVTIYPLDDKENRGKAYVVRNPQNNAEYYVIENFMCARDGWNYYHWRHSLKLDYNVPGLIITHVNGSDSGMRSLSPNNTYGKPAITLLPADGFILASYSIDTNCWYNGQETTITTSMFYEDESCDPYPGKNNVTEIRTYKNYIGADMGATYPITDIRVNDDRSISFKFKGGDPTCITDVQTLLEDNRIFNLNGIFMGNDINSLPRGIYIVNGKKIIAQ